MLSKHAYGLLVSLSRHLCLYTAGGDVNCSGKLFEVSTGKTFSISSRWRFTLPRNIQKTRNNHTIHCINLDLNIQVKAASASTNGGDVTVTVASAEQVLEEWFGKMPVGMPGKDDEMAWERNYRLKWFATASRLSQVDQEIAKRFGATLTQAEKQGLSMLDGTPGWSRSNPRHLVAFIVVLDQFSRHIYRKVCGLQGHPTHGCIDQNKLPALNILTIA